MERMYSVHQWKAVAGRIQINELPNVFLMLIKETGTDELVLGTTSIKSPTTTFLKNISLHQPTTCNQDNQSRVETGLKALSETNYVFFPNNSSKYRMSLTLIVLKQIFESKQQIKSTVYFKINLQLVKFLQ